MLWRGEECEVQRSGPILLVALNGQSPLVRKAAALAAGELREESVKDRLEPMLDSAHTPERMALIFALHRLGDTRFSTSLKRRPSILIRTSAATRHSCSECSAKKAPILVKMMNEDRDPSVRLEAAGSGNWATTAGWKIWSAERSVPIPTIRWFRCWRLPLRTTPDRWDMWM